MTTLDLAAAALLHVHPHTLEAWAREGREWNDIPA